MLYVVPAVAFTCVPEFFCFFFLEKFLSVVYFLPGLDSQQVDVFEF